MTEFPEASKRSLVLVPETRGLFPAIHSKNKKEKKSLQIGISPARAQILATTLHNFLSSLQT
jgi:hypothetical protein